jgi:hypothetical protein
MHLPWWFQPSVVGWWIWTPTVLLFSSYLTWARLRPDKASYVPVAFASVWLAAGVAHYLRGHWQQYYARHLLWLSGMATIVVVPLLPLATVLLVERGAARVLPHPVIRASVAALVALAATFCFQQLLAVWVIQLVRQLGQ